MRLFTLLFPVLFLFTCKPAPQSFSQIIVENLDLALKQYKQLAAAVPDSLQPFSEKPDGSINASRSSWWTSGFFSGTLWNLYRYTKDPQLKDIAQRRLKTISKEQFNDGDHDIGFKIFCSFGNAWDITGDSAYYKVILTAAETATHRFNKIVGLIRSWDALDDPAQYRVIVDNMMNLELLFWATKQTGDSSYFNIAVSHADNTLKNHYRDDGSSYHVLNYDQLTGKVISKTTAQGYSDESAWARGQAWGLYGFIVAYRETGYKRYLEQAKKIAAFIINHPNMPADCIPYWDFNAPDIPEARRDASAGAIMASAMIELSDMVKSPEKERCLAFAKTALTTLSSAVYRSKAGENNNYLLKHGLGHMPNNTEIDVPLIYADYYYVEALLRMRKEL
jgi:unsaturated chondroitin disaccharide hydrolase